MLSQEPSEVLCVDLTLFPLASSDFSKITHAKAECFENPRSQVQGPCAPICVPKFQLPISTF